MIIHIYNNKSFYFGFYRRRKDDFFIKISVTSVLSQKMNISNCLFEGKKYFFLVLLQKRRSRTGHDKKAHEKKRTAINAHTVNRTQTKRAISTHSDRCFESLHCSLIKELKKKIFPNCI